MFTFLLWKTYYYRKLSKKEKKKQLDIEQLNEVDVIKPLKPQENGVHEKQNGWQWSPWRSRFGYAQNMYLNPAWLYSRQPSVYTYFAYINFSVPVTKIYQRIQFDSQAASSIKRRSPPTEYETQENRNQGTTDILIERFSSKLLKVRRWRFTFFT